MTTFAQTPAATTTTAVKVGKGLAVHQGSGFENYPMCGTTRALTTRYSAYKTGTEVEVTCLKCLREMEGNRVAAEREAAQAARSAEIEAEEAAFTTLVEAEAAAEEAPVELTQAERSAAVGAWIEGTIEAIRASTPEVAEFEAKFTKGQVVTLIEDGQGWTVRRINKDGSIRLVNEAGKKINRKASAISAN